MSDDTIVQRSETFLKSLPQNVREACVYIFIVRNYDGRFGLVCGILDDSDQVAIRKQIMDHFQSCDLQFYTKNTIPVDGDRERHIADECRSLRLLRSTICAEWVGK